MVRGHGLVLARAARCHDGHHEKPNRLDSVVVGRSASHARQNLGGDGGERGFAVVQCGEPNAHLGPLDAHVDHPESKLGGQGVFGV